MKAPSDFDKNELCRLKKTLYGQKQSPRAWFGRFTKVILEIGISKVKEVIPYSKNT